MIVNISGIFKHEPSRGRETFDVKSVLGQPCGESLLRLGRSKETLLAGYARTSDERVFSWARQSETT